MNNSGTLQDICAETVPSPRDALLLALMPRGGFIVTDPDTSETIFACTTIDEAFAFMRGEMVPANADTDTYCSVHGAEFCRAVKSRCEDCPVPQSPDHQREASKPTEAVVPKIDPRELARKLGLGQHDDGPQ